MSDSNATFSENLPAKFIYRWEDTAFLLKFSEHPWTANADVIEFWVTEDGQLSPFAEKSLQEFLPEYYERFMSGELEKRWRSPDARDHLIRFETSQLKARFAILTSKFPKTGFWDPERLQRIFRMVSNHAARAESLALTMHRGPVTDASSVVEDFQRGLAEFRAKQKDGSVVATLKEVYFVVTDEGVWNMLQKALEFEEETPTPTDRAHLAKVDRDYVSITSDLNQSRSIIADDTLKTARETRALASLMIARATQPPLAIGLFGNWGQGKSSYMRQLYAQVQLLADNTKQAQKADPKATSDFHPNVAQIVFNAWHYIDANLWASLVTHIFEELARQGQELFDADDLTRKSFIEQTDRASAIGKEIIRLETAEAKTRQDLGTCPLQEARIENGELELETKENEPEPHFVDEAVHEIQGLLGIDAKQAKDFAQTEREIHRFWALVRVWKQSGFIKKHGFPLGVLAVTGVLFAAIAVDQFSGARWLSDLQQVITGLVSCAILAAGCLTTLMQKVNRAMSVAVGARGQAEAWIHMRKQQLESQLQEQHTKLEAARYEQERVHAGIGLYQHIDQANERSEYNDALSIINQIRKDFDTLSTLLKEGRKGERDEVKIPQINRIILYIDDLDRCPPHRVVEVLQAVHLLLAFDLFVVVVGVDARWLLHALRKEYSAFGALKYESAEDTEEAANEQILRSPFETTPINYLEKIFQIPLVLSPLDDTGFGRLIERLLPEEGGTQQIIPSGGDPKPPPKKAPKKSTRRPAPKKKAIPPSFDTALLQREQLKISEHERDFLKTLHPYIEVARLAVRLVNIYRLLKATLPSDELTAFEGSAEDPGNYRLAATLLAMQVGFPAFFRRVRVLEEEGLLFGEIEQLSLKELIEHVYATDQKEGRAEWASRRCELLRCVDAAKTEDSTSFSASAIKTWIPRVGRFGI